MQQLSNEKIERIIELVKVKTPIYDKREKLYKNIEWRDKAWKEIAEKVEADEKICRMAWRSLRDQFSKSMKQLKGHSGQETKLDIEKKQYKFFENLQFLKESCEPRKTSCNFEELSPTEDNGNDSNFWKEIDDLSTQRNCPTTSQNLNIDDVALLLPPSIPGEKQTLLEGNTPLQYEQTSSSLYHSEQPGCSSSTPLKRRKKDSADEQYMNFLNKLLEKTKEQDGVDSFFLGMSENVKKYNLTPSELTQLECKIMLFITEELEKIKNNRL